jgi:hypothetical protein
MSDPDLAAVDAAPSDDPALSGREYLAARTIVAALRGRPSTWLEANSGLTADGKPKVHRQVAWQLTTKPRKAMPSDDILDGLAQAFGWTEAWTRNLFAITIGAGVAPLQFAGLLRPAVDELPIERQVELAKVINDYADLYGAAQSVPARRAAKRAAPAE